MNKQSTYLFLLTFLMFCACKKNETTVVLAGEEDGMYVTEHNITLSADPIGSSWNFVSQEIDIDGDNVNDLVFTNSADSVPNSYKENNYDLNRFNEVDVLHPLIQVSELPGSQIEYTGIIDTNMNYYGTLLYITYTWKKDCEPFPYGNESSDYPTAFTQYQRESITGDLDWEIDYTPYYLSQLPHESLSYTLSAGLDSLTGVHYVIPSLCNSIAPNIMSYIPIRTKKGSEYKYGWVEVSIDEEHYLTIHRSAIEQ